MNKPITRQRKLTWFAGFVVALGAAVLTLHGLTEVALGSGVPRQLGWLYPVITDGLALVAYAATSQLRGAARRYAWIVVILAAGLSGLAQAGYLAGGVPQAPPELKFGIGAWPALAAAVTAHLLYLIGKSGRAVERGAMSSVQPAHSTAPEAADDPGREDAPRDLPAGEQRQPESPEHLAPGDRVVRAEGVQVVRNNSVQPDLDQDRSEHQGVLSTALSPRDRALALAQLHTRRHGSLPSVRDLASQSQVSQGTAASVLRELREQPPELHLINNESSTTDTEANR